MVLIPVVIVHYLRSADEYTAKAQISAPAERVYTTAVAIAQEKDLKILERNDRDLRIEVTDGRQKGSLKAARLAGGKCEVTVTAGLKGAEDRKAQERELALRVFERLCERLGVRYTVTKP